MHEPDDEDELDAMTVTPLQLTTVLANRNHKRERSDEVKEVEEVYPQLSAQQVKRMAQDLERMQENFKNAKEALERRTGKLAAQVIFNLSPQDEWHKILRPVALEWSISMALISGSLFRGARWGLANDDEFWRLVFKRDFAEVIRDFGGDNTLPAWVTARTFTKEDHPGSYLVPWRRYYFWWEFFRRSALRLLADRYMQTAADWIKQRGWRYEDPEQWPRNVEFERGKAALKVAELHTYSFSGGGTHEYGLALAGDHDDIYFPSVLSLRNGVHLQPERYDDDAKPFDEQVENATSPLYWLLYEMDAAMISYQNFKWLTSILTMKLPENAVLPSQWYMNRKENLSVKGTLNFAFPKALFAFGAWYIDKYDGKRRHWGPRYNSVKRIAEVLEYAQVLEGQSPEDILSALPAAPLVGEVLYLNQPIGGCDGCGTQGVALPITCKGCGKGYCTVDCHAEAQ